MAARKLLWKAEVGRGPVQVMVTPDDKMALVANQGSATNPDNRLSLVSLAERKTMATVQVGRGRTPSPSMRLGAPPMSRTPMRIRYRRSISPAAR